jgi:hypothetical protein
MTQPNRHKCLTFVPVGGSDWYKCEAITFVPGEDTTRYKCMHIFVSARVLVWDKCATAIIPSSSPLAEPPPHSSSSSLQLELPHALGSICLICDNFSTISLIEVV